MWNKTMHTGEFTWTGPLTPAAVGRAGESAYVYRAVLVCLVLISVPIKNFAYLVPPVFLLMEVFSPHGRIALRTGVLACFVVGVSSLALLCDSFRGREVNPPGILLGLLTYLPLLMVLCEKFDRVIDEATFQRLLRLICWFVIGQSLIGFVQFALSRNPDAVAGTFGLLDFRIHRITIAQVYFTFTLFGMILLLFTDSRTLLAKVAIVVGLAACALAQSGHQTIFFMAAFGLFTVIRLNRLRTALAVGAALGFLLLVMMQFYPSTFEHTREWWRKVALSERSPKRLAVKEGAAILSEPKNLVLGTGLGQYSSRAAFITSNEYLSVEMPGPLVGKSDYFRSLTSAREVFEEVGEGSAISKPYFSVLSVSVELGLVLSFVLIGVVAVHLGRNLRLMRSPHRRVALTGMAANTGLVLFLLCCLVENYAEFPRAIFLPLLLYVIAISRARTDLSQAPSGQECDDLVDRGDL